MQAGMLRHRLEIQSKTESKDPASGEMVASWSTAATVWGSVEQVGGSDQQDQGRYAAVATHKITIRYRSGIAPANRIKWGSRIFGLVESDNWMQRGIFITLMAKEEL